MNIVCFLLGNSRASEFQTPGNYPEESIRNEYSPVLHIYDVFLYSLLNAGLEYNEILVTVSQNFYINLQICKARLHTIIKLVFLKYLSPCFKIFRSFEIIYKYLIVFQFSYIYIKI